MKNGISALICAIALFFLTMHGAAACSWHLKEGRSPPKGGGIICTDGQSEYETAVLHCETGPLSLDLEGDCGAERTECRIQFSIDDALFNLVGANYPIQEIWDGSIEIPLSGNLDFVDALTNAKSVVVSVEGKASRAMPTEGLPQTIKVLRASCAMRTS